MADVLVLCVKRDLQRAESLADMFESVGLGVAGGPLSAHALETCSAVVVVWSRPAQRCRRFLDAARRAAQSGKAVVASLTTLPPSSAGDDHAFDLEGWRGDPNDPLLDRLLFAVERLAAPARAAATAYEEAPPIPFKTVERTAEPKRAAPPAVQIIGEPYDFIDLYMAMRETREPVAPPIEAPPRIVVLRPAPAQIEMAPPRPRAQTRRLSTIAAGAVAGLALISVMAAGAFAATSSFANRAPPAPFTVSQIAAAPLQASVFTMELTQEASLVDVRFVRTQTAAAPPASALAFAPAIERSAGQAPSLSEIRFSQQNDSASQKQFEFLD